jgi:predicted TIM-barrel fold metal-dependent hydrolase
VKTPHASWRRSIPLIDAHVHLAVPYLDAAVRIMDRVGIARMICLNASTGAKLEEELRAFCAYPGRFFAFAGVDFTRVDAPGFGREQAEALERAVEGGAVGLKMHKSFGLHVRDADDRVLRVDDARLDPVWEKAAVLGVPVAFHTADPKAFFQPLTPHNERWKELSHNPHWSFADRERFPHDFEELLAQLENVVRRHPRTTFLGVHFANDAEDLENVARMLETYPNYYVDTAARIGEMGRHDPLLVREVFHRFSRRILFGTDLGVRGERVMLGAPQDVETPDDSVVRFYADHWRYFETADRNIPHPTPIQGDWTVNAIDLPCDTLARLYHRNAEELILKQRKAD